jgi:hypothetical protein
MIRSMSANGSRISAKWLAPALTVTCVLIAAVFAPTLATAQDEGDTTIPKVFRAKWTVTVKGKAQSDGVFTMEFQAMNEDPREVTVRVLAKSGPKDIRNDLWKELSLATGDRYAVKKDGDQKIVIKKANKQTPHSTLQIKQQNLAGVSIMIQGD